MADRVEKVVTTGDLIKAINNLTDILTEALETGRQMKKERRARLRLIPGGQSARKPKRPAPGGAA